MRRLRCQESITTAFPARRQRPGKGFTLLEVMIAVVLSLVLMAGLWGLFATYESLFSQGQAKVENAQLLRALFEQISQDLKSAIPDSSAGLPGQSASRRFGLFGTPYALQVDVLRMSDSQLLLDSIRPEESGQQDRPARVPELHTVQYLFGEADESGESASGSLTGLVRRELGWDAPIGGGQEPGRGFPGKGASSRTVSVDPMDISAASLDPQDDSLLRVPEVVGLEFRYYDGSAWAEQWNSLTRKSLPVAVEVTLTLKAPQGGRRGGKGAGSPLSPSGDSEGEAAGGESPATPSRAAASEGDQLSELLAEEFAVAETQKHRLLVYLPGTLLVHASRSPSREAPPALEMPVAPSIPVYQPPPMPSYQPPVPSLRSGPRAGSLRAVLPDQWMRGEP